MPWSSTLIPILSMPSWAWMTRLPFSRHKWRRHWGFHTTPSSRYQPLATNTACGSCCTLMACRRHASSGFPSSMIHVRADQGVLSLRDQTIGSLRKLRCDSGERSYRVCFGIPARDVAPSQSWDCPRPVNAGGQRPSGRFRTGAGSGAGGTLMAGSLRVLALFDKPDPLDGPFFEETIYVTPSRLSDPFR